MNKVITRSHNNNSTFAKGLAVLLVIGFFMFTLDSAEIADGAAASTTTAATTTNHTMNGVVQVKEQPTNHHTATTTTTSRQDPNASPSSPAPPSFHRHTYQPRGQPLTDDERQALIEKWGSWTLVDPKRDSRPKEDFYARYPNRDVPRNEFPSNAWQMDKAYLDEFFPQALALVRRAQEAILAEYGKEQGDNSSSSAEEDYSSSSFETRSSMFQTEIMDTWEGETINSPRPSAGQGGFTNRKSWDGFIRRILHSIMTEDSFVFAMGGHSAAAGHGYVEEEEEDEKKTYNVMGKYL